MASGLANLILVVHFLYVLGVILPLLLIPIGWSRGWTWVRSRKIRIAHVGMMGIVVFEIIFGIACPLTALENKLLFDAGKSSYQDEFVAHWLSKIMYWQMPYWVFVVIYLAVFALIVLLWRRYPPTEARGTKA